MTTISTYITAINGHKLHTDFTKSTILLLENIDLYKLHLIYCIKSAVERR